MRPVIGHEVLADDQMALARWGIRIETPEEVANKRLAEHIAVKEFRKTLAQLRRKARNR